MIDNLFIVLLKDLISRALLLAFSVCHLNGKAGGISEGEREMKRNKERQFVRREGRGRGMTTWNRVNALMTF